PRLPSLAFASSFLAPPTPPLSTLSLHAALPCARDLLPHVLAALRAELPPSLRPRRPTRRGPCGGRFRGPTRSWSRSWSSSRRTLRGRRTLGTDPARSGVGTSAGATSYVRSSGSSSSAWIRGPTRY